MADIGGMLARGALGGIVGAASGQLEKLRGEAKEARLMSMEAFRQKGATDLQTQRDVAADQRLETEYGLKGEADIASKKLGAGLLRGTQQKGVMGDTGTTVSVAEWNAMTPEDQSKVVGKELYKNTLAINLATSKALTPEDLKAPTAAMFNSVKETLSTTKGWDEKPASVRLMMTQIESLKVANPGKKVGEGTKVLEAGEEVEIAKKMNNKEISMSDLLTLTSESQQRVMDEMGKQFSEKDTLWSDVKGYLGETMEQMGEIGYTPQGEGYQGGDIFTEAYGKLKSTFEGLRPKQ